MDYTTATTEEIAAHFKTISRQRICQILNSWRKKGDEATVAKLLQAKALLKTLKYKDKRGCTVRQYEKARSLWVGINRRCGREPNYLDCTVGFPDEATFREWCVKQIGFDEKGFELDKDVLVKGSRVYSATTCVFVPAEINSALSGCYKSKRRGAYPLGVCFNKGSGSFVAQMNKDKGTLDKYLGSFPTVEEAFACYKEAKEAKIKSLAEKWKDRIDPAAYAALMARTVEWDD